jgi:ferredoxin
MVNVNTETCIGCGSCEVTCPKGFEMKDDNKAHVKDANAECIKEAIDVCPVDAISA